jgi:hypothetical protein
MDKLQQYRQVLPEQTHPYSHSNDVDTEIICDTRIMVFLTPILFWAFTLPLNVNLVGMW